MNSTEPTRITAPPEGPVPPAKKKGLGRVLIVTGVVRGLGMAVTPVQDHGDEPA